MANMKTVCGVYRCLIRCIQLWDVSFVIYKLYPNDDAIKWKHFPCYWPFVRGIHGWPVNAPHKGQWRRALMFSLIGAWINGWVNNRETGDPRHYRAYYDVTVTGQCNTYVLKSMCECGIGSSLKYYCINGRYPLLDTFIALSNLTHWGRVTHICVSNWFIIGSDNGLSPGPVWPAPSHYLNQCWNVVDWTPGNKLQWNFSLDIYILFTSFIHTFENVARKMAAILSRPHCVEAIIVNEMCLQGPQWCLTLRYTFLLWWSRSCYCSGTPMVSHLEIYLSLVVISILLLSRDPNGVSPRGIPFSCGDLDPVIVQGPQWCLTPRYTFLLWWSRSCYCPGTPMVSHPEVYLSLVVISILLLSRDPNGVSPRGIPFSCGDLDPIIVQGPQWCLTPMYTFLLWWSRSCYCPGTPMLSHPEVNLSLVAISILLLYSFILHDDVIKWKHFPRYWPFVRGIHRSRWIPRTTASDAELWCFIWCTSE